MEKNILVVDDNEGIIDVLSTYLQNEGYTPISAFDGEEALEKFRENNLLLILLDIMLPKKDGYEVCKEIRKESNIPIIMITSKVENADRIMGLDIGADDYVVKPFSPSEVMARIRAVLRRIDLTDEQKNKVIKYSRLEISIADYKVKVNDEVVNLTKKETEIIWLLASNPNKVFSRDALLNSIWGHAYYGGTRAVDSHIKRIRSKLNLQDQKKWDIKTIWGVGYKFEVNDV